MCSKFIKLIVLLSLLVCCGFAGRVLYSRFVQSFSRTRERSTSHRHYIEIICREVHRAIPNRRLSEVNKASIYFGLMTMKVVIA